jgi:hypothetical protein
VRAHPFEVLVERRGPAVKLAKAFPVFVGKIVLIERAKRSAVLKHGVGLAYDSSGSVVHKGTWRLGKFNAWADEVGKSKDELVDLFNSLMAEKGSGEELTMAEEHLSDLVHGKNTLTGKLGTGGVVDTGSIDDASTDLGSR